MRFKISSFLLLSVLLFSGCSFSPNELRVAERMMSESPDSALHVLQRMQSVNSLSDDDRALYGLLYFEALDKNNEPLQPDSLITFSLNYYQSKGENKHLAKCFFYKARMYKQSQRFDDATVLYLKVLDVIDDNNYQLLGEVYSDMAYMCSIQQEYKESLSKYQYSINCFKRAGMPLEASYRVLEIGRTYRFMKKYAIAHKYYLKALSETKDSFLRGVALQEIGVNYYWEQKFDSSQYYLRKSLHFPYKGYNFAIRCYTLADLYFDTEQYDSSLYYASKALKYPCNFGTRRECYRLLANTEYVKGNFKQMAVYMTSFQALSDSVRKIESQTKTTVLEGIYQTKQEASKAKKFLFVLAWLIPVIILISLFIVFKLRKRNLSKEKQLEEAGMLLSQKQSMLIDNLLQKIKEQREMQAVAYKKSTLAQREQMDKSLYNKCLHLDNWEAFMKLMNQTFKDIITHFENNYPEVTHKELTWICLFLLNIPTPDIALILESQPSSLYKLKQRLTLKIGLKKTKELDQFLDGFSESRSSESQNSSKK